MKKLLYLLLFAITCTLNAQAQEKKELTPTEKANKNLFELTNAIDTNGNDQFFATLKDLFLTKQMALAKDGITDAEKKQVYATVDKKLRTIFSEDQLKTISQQPGLYDRLLKE